jgi:O-antigen/teichoic acid export membrane protein
MSIHTQTLLAMLNTATAALGLFVVFRLGFQETGGDFIGLWALVSGLLMFARLADTGASLSVARLAVIGRAQNATGLGPYLWSGLTVATIPTLLLSTIIVLLASLVLSAEGSEASRISLLPQLLAAAWFYAIGNSAAGILSGCIDGAGRMTWRYSGGVTANVVLIGLAVWLLPALGEAGFLLAHIAYIAVQIAIYALLLLATRADLSTTRTAYVTATRDSAGFLSKSIFMGAARTGFEPVSKMLIGQFGGLTAVALFDLAVRVSNQLRQLGNAPLQPLAVLTARSSAALQDDHKPIIERWMIICIFGGLTMALFQIVSAPILSWIIIGHIDGSFIFMSNILAVAFFVNFSGTVAFYVVTSSGQLGGLLRMHAIMTVINISLGFVLGSIWGTMGVVFAWGATLAVSGPAALFIYLAENPLSRRTRKHLVLLFSAGLLALMLAASLVAALQPEVEEMIDIISSGDFTLLERIATLHLEPHHA